MLLIAPKIMTTTSTIYTSATFKSKAKNVKLTTYKAGF